MIGMVAFAKTSDSTLKTTPRARGQHRTYTSRPSPCFNSSTQANLRTATHKKRKRLGSCSKDPIGFVGGLSHYKYSEGTPLSSVDSYGTNSCKVKSATAFKIVDDCGVLPGLGYGFSFTSEFEFDDDCGCECCSYDQWVLSQKAEVFVYDKKGVLRIQTTVFERDDEGLPDCIDEDGISTAISGKPAVRCYGDRDNQVPGDSYSEDGCKYSMKDSPHFKYQVWLQELIRKNPRIAPVIGNVYVRVTYRFLGRVVDTCQKQTVWSQTFEKTCDSRLIKN
jgi:hypothetical protein